MDFNNKVLWKIYPLGVEVWITETIFNTWIIMGFLIILALVCRRLFFKDTKEKPSGLQNVIELIVETMSKFAMSILGKNYAWLDQWFFAIFAFVICSNLSGLMNLRNPTADVATTLALSCSTFALVQGLSFLKNPKGYVKGFCDPFVIFFPINVIGDLSIIISLGFRLFGNILAGVILSGLLYNLLPRALTIIFPAIIHAYFDVFAGVLQTYIFCVLSMTFIKNKVAND